MIICWVKLSYLPLQRYLAIVLGRVSNSNWGAVARDIVDAILAAQAKKNKPAIYQGQPEQKKQLQAVYEKWGKVTDVWSVAAPVMPVFLLCIYLY